MKSVILLLKRLFYNFKKDGGYEVEPYIYYSEYGTLELLPVKRFESTREMMKYVVLAFKKGNRIIVRKDGKIIDEIM